MSTNLKVAPPPLLPPGVSPAITSKRDYNQEYVTTNGYNQNVARILSQVVERIEENITPETFERMENDPVFRKIKNIIVTGVLSDDPQFAPGATAEEAGSDGEYQRFVDVMEFCERVVFGMETPIRSVWKQMLDGLGQGHKIGEIIWRFQLDPPPQGPNGDSRRSKLRLMPVAIKAKPRQSIRFVVDSFWNVLGFMPMFNRMRAGQTSYHVNEIIPRDKCCVFTWDMQNCDPRGNSAWRAGFQMWSLRQHIPGEFLRYLLQCAVPGLVAKLPPDATPFDYVYDEQGNPVPDPESPGNFLMETAVMSMRRIVEGYRNSTGAVIPHDAELDPIKTGDANGDVFPNAFKTTGREIEASVLLQTLAQTEGDHQSKAASGTVEGRLYALFFWVKWLLAQMTLKDVCEPAVRKNLGDWAVAYMPTLSLGDSEPRDWVAYLEALSDAYFKGLLDDTQRPEVMAWMQLPKPGTSQKELDRQAGVGGQGANQDPRTGTADPKNRPDKPTPSPGTGGPPTPRKESDNEDIRFSSLNSLGHPGRRFVHHVRLIPRSVAAAFRRSGPE